jgi:predicted nucleic acid-binding protein
VEPIKPEQLVILDANVLIQWAWSTRPRENMTNEDKARCAEAAALVEHLRARSLLYTTAPFYAEALRSAKGGLGVDLHEEISVLPYTQRTVAATRHVWPDLVAAWKNDDDRSAGGPTVDLTKQEKTCVAYDAMSLAIAIEREATLLATWDKGLLRHAGRFGVLTRVPSEALQHLREPQQLAVGQMSLLDPSPHK